MGTNDKQTKDERVERILELIIKYAKFDFKERERISGKGDELDAIIVGLNTLGEELEHSKNNPVSGNK
jgi:hypothetical protein